MTLHADPKKIGNQHRILIESGSWDGTFVESVRTKYDHVHTIEIIESLYNNCNERFKNVDNVTCHFGDSPAVLKEILKDINEPVIFWLDAHWQGHNQPEGTKAPLLSELEVIKTHHIKTHTIMIDDVRLFSTYNTSKAEIENIIRSINPNYKIEYVNGHVPNDVVVGRI